ncbi:MAG: amidohydrolase family protein, partial [Muribaculaceae bacterium]|nr:amidohydrolase family protein [Muribaculaceae bacterium]
CRALSVDHLEQSGDREIECLKNSDVIPVVLPGASFFLGMPFAPARGMVDAGLPLAMASDYNPGSSPSGDMRFVMALGCIRQRLTPEEAFRAVTINGAAAMDCAADYGSITRGKVANFIITTPDVKELGYIPYAYTTPYISRIYLKGKEYK